MITVIIPILNAMPYLPEALNSLESQSFRDFEVCLWDNGSTDGSVEEARRWIPGRLKGRVVTGKSLPLHECLARMVDEAQTEFVARMDGDDVCLPERFRLQTNFFLENPEVALLGGQIRCISPSGDFLSQDEWARYALTHSDIVSRMMVLGPFNHPSIMFRRGAVMAAGNYRVPAPVEDHNLYLKLVQNNRVANLPEVLTYYRIHAASICASACKNGLHNQLALESTARESLRIFGIDSNAFSKMRQKKHPLVALPLARSALWRAKRENTPVFRILKSQAFTYSSRCMIADNDILSRVFFRIVDAQK